MANLQARDRNSEPENLQIQEIVWCSLILLMSSMLTLYHLISSYITTLSRRTPGISITSSALDISIIPFRFFWYILAPLCKWPFLLRPQDFQDLDFKSEKCPLRTIRTRPFIPFLPLSLPLPWQFPWLYCFQL